MPIKFRCTHCNQFLGISRAQSGMVVDCPSCGRSIRVPNLDGTVAPLPRASINLSDSSLASALEQLASLDTGLPDLGAGSSPPATASRVAAPPAVITVPVSSPVGSLSDAPMEIEPNPSGKPWIEVEEQLASLADNGTRLHDSRREAGVRRRDVLVASSTALAVAPFTWLLARMSQPAPQANDVTSTVEQSAPAVRPAPGPIPAGTHALTGRITYVNADGESHPDAGARILIFPEQRQGSTLLPTDGFRANAAAADLQLAQESMKFSGGAYVVADEHGRYGADLSSSGNYAILIISNYKSRPAGALPADLHNSLARYFDRPQHLIGQTAYEFSHLRFTGREPAVRDHVFQQA